MHVMHVLGSFGPGGAEMGVVRLIKAMSELPVRHSVCSIGPDLTMKSHLPDTVECFSLGFEGAQHFAFRTLAAVFKSRKIDIVHVNNIGPWFDAALASKLAGARCIQTFHGVEDILFELSPLKKIQIYFSWKLSSALTAVSSAAAELFSELTGIGISHLRIINNGVDTDFFSPLDQAGKKAMRLTLGLPEDSVLVGCVAALRPVKNHTGLLSAFKTVMKTCGDSVLVFVGDGPLADELKNQCSESGLSDHVVFAGRQDNVYQYLKSFDIFVLNSKTEGLSYAVLEAMACGLPVVASDVGGNSQLIENNKDGFLYPEGDEKTLSKILVQLIGNNEIARKAGTNARHKIVKNYSLKSVIRKYFALYNSLL